MNTFDQLIAFIRSSVVHGLDDKAAQAVKVTLNVDAQRQQFGDLSTNAPLICAKLRGQSPQACAQELIAQIVHPDIERIEPAGAGFLNIFLKPAVHERALRQYAERGDLFVKPDLGCVKNYNVEFVSANPTGPLHFGHGRGGIIGDVLARVLRFAGQHVTSEFYVNDAGSQIDRLGQSLKARCLQLLGQEVTVPEDGYQGEYLIDVARLCVDAHGKQVLTESDEFFKTYALEHLLAQVKKTLSDYRIHFDVWFSERTLHESAAVANAIEQLRARGYTYEQDGAVWFKSTQFGDDKDRVLRRADGQPTYVGADVAYLLNKIERGTQHAIMVLGQDHHSFAVRLKGIQQALGVTDCLLDVILYQLVTIKKGGESLRMSKRAGTMVTLDDIIAEVGADAARFFYLNRKADAQLEFDIELARQKTVDNPVFYLQYAAVRISSLLKKAADMPGMADVGPADVANLGPAERVLVKKMAALRDVLTGVCLTYHTHLIAYYALELAQQFHAYYMEHTVLDASLPAQSRMRLVLARQIRQTLVTCLDLMGISVPETM